LEKLGEGGMGVVYKAEDTKLGRIVALKFLPPHISADREEKKRFIHEAKAASKLDHKNICTVYEIDEAEDGRMFIAMAYYEGKTLKDKIQRGPLKLEGAMDTAIQVAEGLKEAHEKNIVHRDIKPANIMVTSKGQVKIMDFGLAKLTGRTKLTKTGTTLGTVAYMSPEQTRGDKFDHRSDIWSLGVMLYEMIAGQLPFKGDYDQAVAYSIVNEEPEPLARYKTGVPDELQRIVEKTLRKDKNTRYQSAVDLLTDLKALPKVPIRSAEARPEKKSIRRHHIALAGVGFLLVLTVFALFSLTDINLFKIRKQAVQTIDESQWQNSIAVLPFRDFSPNKDQEYFCNGMTDQIITNLSHLQDLKVIALTSVMRFKDTKKPIPEIASELNVAHILEGSIRKAGNQIRVTAQLVHADQGYHLWADDFTRELKDVFAVQDDVSENIARALLKTLSPEEIGEIKTKRPANTEAYEYFLKARYFLKKYERHFQLQDFKTCEAMYKNAIDLDPEYAPSYAALSRLYHHRFSMNPEEREKYFPLQEKNIKIALDLDPYSAEVFFYQFFYFMAEGEREKMYETLKRVLNVDPNHSDANMWLGAFLQWHGLSHHSLIYINKAMELDPVDPWNHSMRGWVYEDIGEFEKAAQAHEDGLEIEPDDHQTLYLYTTLLLMLKKSEEAEKMLNRLNNNYPDRNSTKNLSILLMAVKGDSVGALRLSEESRFPKSLRIMVYSILGKKDETLAFMQELQDEQDKAIHSSNYLQYINLLWYDNLRKDDRFKVILAEEKKRYDYLLKKYGYEN
jgi:non-specific serine/threonine protein kinase